jgi:hypothetical protein
MASSRNEPCAELLSQQHGVIARWQALQCGLPSDAIAGHLRYGRWHQLYRGVYLAFTGEPNRLALLWGAVLRAGRGAALSHHSAAELDKITDEVNSTIHVSVETARCISIRAGEQHAHAPPVTVHRSARLVRARHPARVPPRTRVEETVLDLTQASGDLEEAVAWVTHACSRRLTTGGLLLAAMAERTKLRWRAELTDALSEASTGVHSRLEWRYVRHVERPHGLPRATRQSTSRARRRTRYFDNEYEQYGVAVELDGKAAHPSEARWRDIHRDNASAAAGLVTLRYSWADVTLRRCHVAAEVAAVLQIRGWPGRLRPCGPACAAPRFARP